MSLCAFAVAAMNSTWEIWVYWLGGLGDWFSGGKTQLGVLFCVLALGFIAGWLSRTSVPSKAKQLTSLVAYIIFNVAMYSLTRTAIEWVDYARINQGLHVSGAMKMLIVSLNSGVLLIFTSCSLIAVTVTAFVQNGKYQEVCGFFTICCWIFIIALGFINAACLTIQL